MKSSGFRKKEIDLLKPTSFLRRTKRMKSKGKIAPTVEEKEWMNFVASFGCVVCWLKHKVNTPCAVHHIIEGSRRLCHMFTIGLCDPGHHQNSPDKELKISRHPDKARFELEYGTEYELHAYLVWQRKLECKP